jgi:hypothetical protein
MTWDQFSHVADILSMMSALMTIIGVGGFVTWWGFGDKSLSVSERAWSIAGFGIRTFVACLAMIPLFLLWTWCFGAIAALAAGSWQGQLWDSTRPVAFAVSHLAAAVIFLPVTIAVFVGIVTARVQPIKRLVVHTLRPTLRRDPVGGRDP